MTDIDPTILQKLSDEFDAVLQQRHIMGQEKYGPVKFLEVNSLEEAMAEVADLANYARYTWIKLALMAHLLDKSGPVEVVINQKSPNDGPVSVAKHAGFFHPTGR